MLSKKLFSHPQFCQLQENKQIELLYNQQLSNYTTMKVGGVVECMISPLSIESFTILLSICHQDKIPYFILGKGSNLLINDKGLEIIVINTKYLSSIYLDSSDSTKVIVESGCTLKEFAEFALEHSLTGAEFTHGIPGTIGGGVFMNAGAYGSELKDIVVSSLIWDEGQKNLSYENHEFSYRFSAIAKNNQVLLKTTFQLQKGDKVTINTLMEDLLYQRTSKQPLDLPSFGSVFKRPEGYFAGKLIQDSGLQGATRGGASVSTKHAGFIVNHDNAKAQDVLDLIAYIQSTVYEKQGVFLEPEVKILESNGCFKKI